MSELPSSNLTFSLAVDWSDFGTSSSSTVDFGGGADIGLGGGPSSVDAAVTSIQLPESFPGEFPSPFATNSAELRGDNDFGGGGPSTLQAEPKEMATQTMVMAVTMAAKEMAMKAPT